MCKAIVSIIEVHGDAETARGGRVPFRAGASKGLADLEVGSKMLDGPFERQLGSNEADCCKQIYVLQH